MNIIYKRILLLSIFIVSLFSFTTFFSFSRYTSVKTISSSITTKELKIEFSILGNANYQKTQSSTVNITDTHSNNVVSKYLWSTSNTANASNGTVFQSGDEISNNTLSGIYYLCIYASDDKGFSLNECSDAFYFDNEAPVLSIASTSDLKSSSQVATLTMSDISAIDSYYFGTTNPETNTVTWTDYSSDVVIETVNTAGTYYFAAKDILGNVSYDSITFNNYTVINMLISATGTLWNSVDCDEISRYTYIAPTNTTIVLTDVYTVPEYSQAGSGRFTGYSLGEPSVEEASKSTTNPILTTDTSYTMWFNRNAYYFRYRIYSDEIYRKNSYYSPNNTGVYNTYDYSVNNGYMYRSINGGSPTIMQSGYRYGVTEVDIANHKSGNFSIEKLGYAAVPGQEWLCVSGCKNANQTFSQSPITDFNFSDYSSCDLSVGNCVIALRVNWQPTNYNITYELNGGTVADANPTTYTVNSSTITLNNPTKEGYVFTGWTEQTKNIPWIRGFIRYTDGEIIYSDTYSNSYFTEMIKLKGGTQYTISGYGTYLNNPTGDELRWRIYDLNKNYLYDESSSNSQTVNYTPAGDRYIRLVYLLGPTTSQMNNTIITNDAGTMATIPSGSVYDKNFIANYELSNYTITYVLNGGKVATANPTSYTIESANITLNNPTRTGYTFKGWSGTDLAGTTNTSVTISTGSTGDRSYTANWQANTYTVEYYQGAGSNTSTKFATTSSHTYNTAKNLTTYEALGGTAPSGWTFAGWSTTADGTTVTYTDGQSVKNLTATNNGTIKLYAVFKRDIVFQSGTNGGTIDAIEEQYYNPYATNKITSVTTPASLTSITSWTATGTGTGFRNDATAESATVGFNATVTPAYNSNATTYYGVYRKVINVYSGVSKATNNSQTQYLNTNGNKVTAISLAVPADVTDWTKLGYRTNTTAAAAATAVTTAAVSVTPAYSTSAINYYAVYSRTATVNYYSGQNAGTTSSQTVTAYYNTNAASTATTTTFTLKTAADSTDITGWTEVGWRDDTSADNKEYDYGQTGVSITLGGTLNFYSVYSRNITVYSGLNKATNETKTQYLNTNNNTVGNISVSAPAAIDGWTALGYRDDTTAGAKEYGSAAAGNVKPAFSTGTVTLYAVYSKTATVNYYSGQNAETTSSQTATAYYNTNAASTATTTTITLKAASDSTDITGWTEVGWRDDTSAANREYTYGQTNVTVTLGETTNFYSVYSRNITVYSGLNKSASETKTQYLNTNNNTVGNISVSAPTAIEEWTALGYRDDTTAGAKEYGSAAAGNVKPAFSTSAVTLYAVYSKNAIANYYSGQNKATAVVQTVIGYYNTNTASAPTTTTFTLKTAADSTDITGWTEVGWRDDTSAGNREYTYGQTGVTITLDGTLDFYSVYSRSITVYSGLNKATSETKTQYLNTNNNTVGNISVSAPAAIDGWTALGYRDDTTAGAKEYGSAAAGNVKPAFSTSAVTLYAVYSKTATANYYSGQNAETTSSQTVTGYYNTNTASAPTTTTFTLKTAADSTDITGWTEVGWRDDTSAGNREYTYGQTGVTITLDGTLNFYSVYSRSITVYSGVSKATSETKTQYLNTNNNTVGNISVSAPAAIDGWTALGYRDDTTAGAKEYGSAAAGNVKPAFSTSAVTLYAVYSRTLTITYAANSGTGTVNDTTATIYLNTDSTTTSSQAVTLSNTTFTRTGYRFSKWTVNGTDYNKNTSYNPSLAYDAADANWTITATAKWAANTYTVEYYQGAGSSTSTKFETTSSHTYDTAKKLTTYATLGGTAPSGWTFAGWSTTADGTTVAYTDGQSVSNLTSTHGGTVALYAVFKRNVVFKSGASAGTTNATQVQYYNPYATNKITAVTAPSSLTAINGWTALGYRNDTTASTAGVALGATNVKPAYNSTATTYYGVYSRTINVYSGVNKATSAKATQYLNASGNTVSAISVAAPSTTNLSGQSWTALGYRDDTTAGAKEYGSASAGNVTPAYSAGAVNLYAVYSRTVTLKHNGNSNTGGSTSNVTGTQYYNSNNSVSTVSLTTRANGFTRTGYNFSKWAVDSTSGTQIAAGAATTFAPAVNSTSLTKNVYAIWTAKSITCSAKKYLPANSETCTNCTAGSYCPGGTWTYNGSERGRTACAAGSYSAASASACTACQGNTSNAGSSSCNKSCGKSNVSTWNTATWNSSNNTVSNSCSIKACANGYTLQSNNCNDVTAPSVPTTLQLYNPVLKANAATYSLKVSGSSDVNTITYQVKINGSWQNCSNGVYNGSLANSSTSYTIEARACDSAGNCSGSASRKIWLNPKRLYVWQLYQYMRTNSGSTIIAQPTEDEVTTNARFDKSASNANGMYNQTEAVNYFNSVGVNQAVKNLYRGILGRDADSDGLTFQVSQVNSLGRAAVIKNFVNSDEAQNIYSAWGIGAGKI